LSEYRRANPLKTTFKHQDIPSVSSVHSVIQTKIRKEVWELSEPGFTRL